LNHTLLKYFLRNRKEIERKRFENDVDIMKLRIVSSVVKDFHESDVTLVIIHNLCHLHLKFLLRLFILTNFISRRYFLEHWPSQQQIIRMMTVEWP